MSTPGPPDSDRRPAADRTVVIVGPTASGKSRLALSLGERLIAAEQLLPIVRVWLTTPFEGGRHARRVALIDGNAR